MGVTVIAALHVPPGGAFILTRRLPLIRTAGSASSRAKLTRRPGSQSSGPTSSLLPSPPPQPPAPALMPTPSTRTDSGSDESGSARSVTNSCAPP